MENNSKIKLGWYAFAAIGGLASGLLFSKSQYYKGQADAYDDIANDLQGLSSKIEEGLSEKDEEAE